MYQIHEERQPGQIALLIPAMLDDHFPLLRYAFFSPRYWPVILTNTEHIAEYGPVWTSDESGVVYFADSLGHAELCKVEDGPRLAPRGERERHVASDYEGQVVSRAALMQPPEGSDRVRRSRDLGLHERDLEPLLPRHRAPAELDAVLDPGIALGGLVRRLVHRHEQHPLEL